MKTQAIKKNPKNVAEEECRSEQVENTYWRVVMLDIEGNLKYQLFQTVCVWTDLPNLYLLLEWTSRNYVEVDNPVEGKFSWEIEVIFTLLEKRGLENIPTLKTAFLTGVQFIWLRLVCTRKRRNEALHYFYWLFTRLT